MEQDLQNAVIDILSHFEIKGEWLRGAPFGSGHIHDTYLTYIRQHEAVNQFILQKVNSQVFTRTALVCDNIQIVGDHIYNKLKERGIDDLERRAMQVIPTTKGGSFYQDNKGGYWRLFSFIKDTIAVDEVRHSNQAYEAARAIGEFQELLSDLDATFIGESIPNFHHIGWRYENLDQAIEDDIAGRKVSISEEIIFAQEMKSIRDEMLVLLENGNLPIRITHNDTKINNVLLDAKSGKGICVIDLDTVMPGSVIYDFGDMVRTFTSPSPEDEADLTKVYVRLDIFEALVKGYLETAKAFIQPVEIEHLILGAKLITLIMGIRFLTDYLNGDVYYKIRYPEQNLRRARNQFHLVKDLIAKESQMQSIIAKYT